MHHKARVGIDTRKHSFKRKVPFLHPMQEMRKETDLAGKDFFEKNLGKKKEEVWRRVKGRLRSKQNSTDQDKEVYAMRRREKIAPLILKRRIWWEPVPGASSYVVYVNKDRTIFEPNNFSHRWKRC